VGDDDELLDWLFSVSREATLGCFGPILGAEKKARCDDHSGHGEKTWTSRHGSRIPIVARFIWLPHCQKLCRKL
jgi:hypothetical protein